MDLATVIIVNWNGRHLLPDCLQSLREQEFKQFKTILVDNGSSDGSVDWVRSNYPEVKVIPLTKNTGFCVANNVGYKAAKSKYIALLNNDAIAHPSWLQHLVLALETHDRAGFAASKILNYENPFIIDRAGDSYTRAGSGLLRGRGMASNSYDKKEWIFGACAAAALYRRYMIDEIGFFNEDFFLIYEDVDLSFRAQLKGYRCLYVPEATIYHKTSSSIIRDSPTSIYFGHRNLEWVYFQNMPGRLLARTILLHLVYCLGSFLYFSCNGRMKNILWAKKDAFKNIKRVLRNRRLVQKEKRAENSYIWSLLEKEHFFGRLKARLPKRNPPLDGKECP